jgi:ABC-type nitrate/sulfonate/bicarbonate transport system substrate-binding protein
MVTEKFASDRHAEHTGILQALDESCLWCNEAANRESLAQILAGPTYINQSARIILPALVGAFDRGHGDIANVSDFHVFHGRDVNCPTGAKAAQLQRDLVEAGLLKSNAVDDALPSQLFRTDLFQHALSHSPTHELVS